MEGVSQTCPLCGATGQKKVVERFDSGRFLACGTCGIHYADAPGRDLEEYYEQIWSRQGRDSDPYEQKRRAARNPRALRRLLREMPRFRWAVSRLAKLPPGRVLDIGCGEGTVLWGAQSLGHDVHGLDLSPSAVAIARTLLGTDSVRVGTLENAHFDPATFDCVVALEVIEHLPNGRAFLRDVVSLLKPTGVLLLTTPNRRRLFAAGKRLLGLRQTPTDYPPHHLTRWSCPTLRRLLGEFFAEVKVGTLPYYFSSGLGRRTAYLLHILLAGKTGQCLRGVGSFPNSSEVASRV